MTYAYNLHVHVCLHACIYTQVHVSAMLLKVNVGTHCTYTQVICCRDPRVYMPLCYATCTYVASPRPIHTCTYAALLCHVYVCRFAIPSLVCTMHVHVCINSLSGAHFPSTCLHDLLYVCMYVCMYVCIYIYIYIYTHTDTFIYTHTSFISRWILNSKTCNHVGGAKINQPWPWMCHSIFKFSNNLKRKMNDQTTVKATVTVTVTVMGYGHGHGQGNNKGIIG